MHDELWEYTFTSFLSDAELFYPTSFCCKAWQRLALKHIRRIYPPFSSPQRLFNLTPDASEKEKEQTPEEEPRGWLPHLLQTWGCGETLREFDATHLIHLDDSFFERTLLEGLSHPEKLSTLLLDLRSYRSRGISVERVHDKPFRDALLRLTGLTSLSIGYFSSITDEALHDIPSFSNLTSLSLVGVKKLTESAVQGILSQCASTLTRLRLQPYRHTIGHACLTPIHHSPILTHLRVAFSHTGMSTVPGYARNLPPNLESLEWLGFNSIFCAEDLYNLPRTIKHLKLPRQQELATLTLEGEDTRQLLPPGLISLQCYDPVHLTENFVRTLPTSLTDLDMTEWTDATPDWLTHLSRLTNLQSFTMQWTNLSGDWLPKCLPPQLKRLKFHTRGNISETDLIGLPSGLVSVEISTQSLDPACLRHLPLSVEKLSCTALNQKIESLRDRTALRALKLTVIPTQTDLAEQLHLLPPNLEILALHGFDRITKELLSAVPRHLKSLRFNLVTQWEGDFGPVMAELPTTLRKLTIINGHEDALKGDEFLDALPPNITFLDLSGCWAHDATRQLTPLFSEAKLSELGRKIKIILP